MKKIKYLAVLFFLFTACKKKSSSSGQNSPTIVGQWIWFKTISPIDPTITPQSSGHSWGLKFNNDSTCVQSGDLYPGGLGAYSLSYTVAPLASGTSLKITIATSVQNYIYSIKSSDTLTLFDPTAPPAADGSTYYFVKR